MMLALHRMEPVELQQPNPFLSQVELEETVGNLDQGRDGESSSGTTMKGGRAALEDRANVCPGRVRR